MSEVIWSMMTKSDSVLDLNSILLLDNLAYFRGFQHRFTPNSGLLEKYLDSLNPVKLRLLSSETFRGYPATIVKAI
ncbi:hypothetical protein AGMMS49975_03180 [Clostridia bacterium]|nr:hypothetical protein AGMMS49975_03180 [Clostridia bacterium]